MKSDSERKWSSIKLPKIILIIVLIPIYCFNKIYSYNFLCVSELFKKIFRTLFNFELLKVWFEIPFLLVETFLEVVDQSIISIC